MELTAEDDVDDEISDSPHYLAVSSISAFPNEKELLFSGKRVKFRISNIYKGGFGKKYGHRLRLSTLNKIQKMLRNGDPKWKAEELAMFKEFCSLKYDEYVLLTLLSQI